MTETLTRDGVLLSRLRGEMETRETDLIRRLQDGDILVPSTAQTNANRAGGVNRYPNADYSYSTLARTVAGTTPATAGDLNFEAYRHYRQTGGSNLTLDSTHALKSVGHSLYAANELVDPDIPDWDREQGWARFGSLTTQYDIAVELSQNPVRAGKPYYFRAKLVSLTNDPLPPSVELFAGFWEKRASDEGWIEGNSFTLSHSVKGIPGTTSVDYRALAKTDSGVSILSDVLTVTNVPNVLSDSNYVQLYFNAGPGFIEYQIFKKVGGVYYHVYDIRNSTDLQYDDTGYLIGKTDGWPSASGSVARAYAKTGGSRKLLVAPFGQVWAGDDLTIVVPQLYNFKNSVKQFLRYGLTAPVSVGRQIGIDQIWLSDTYNEWTEDFISPFPDGTDPIPSISPTSSFQGGGSGVFNPPSGGSGGGDGREHRNEDAL